MCVVSRPSAVCVVVVWRATGGAVTPSSCFSPAPIPPAVPLPSLRVHRARITPDALRHCLVWILLRAVWRVARDRGSGCVLGRGVTSREPAHVTAVIAALSTRVSVPSLGVYKWRIRPVGS